MAATKRQVPLASVPASGALRGEGARERILEAAYALFSRHGVSAVGVDRIVAHADVAKATLYHHFPSKDALIIAFLDLREQRWTRDWLQGEAERRASRPQERALAVFDALDEWFRRPDYEGCSFLNTLLEVSDQRSAVYKHAVQRLAVVRELLESYAAQAAVSDPLETSYQLQIVLMGAIVSAGRGDLDAARRARAIAVSLLERGAGRRRRRA
jgi:AcrR family transcriptional regulator